MASDPREFDLLILGASGFTGKYVVRESLKFLSTPGSPLRTLALAGRNPNKISQTLAWASSPNPPPKVPILHADVSDSESLIPLFCRARLVLSCVGPFRLHGAPVVAACVAAGADYLDISGEPEFMERMEAEFHENAVKAGSLVVSACGFDSVPAELGVVFNSRQWVAPSVPNRVEAYLSLESEKKIVGNLGTFESAVLGVANADKLQELRRSRPRRARPLIPGPPPPKGPLIEHQKFFGLWAVKLPSADSIVVRRTLAALAENPHGLPGVDESEDDIERRARLWSTVKPVHFGVKIGTKSLLGILRIMVTGIFIGLFGKLSFGRNLLLKYPEFFSLGWFSKAGPTEEEVNSATFKMWFLGHGYSDVSLASRGAKPDTEIITRISGPEIGYLTTPIILIQCALIVLGQRGKLPKGGVFPPGIVFVPTDLQERLQENGISFDFISKRALPA
ncbi:hypothetical protein J5N97_010309 [Dioscorea zingiberensis]|uniref:Saccharopine dehydrogenase NADP binding domain-containing protein n=1 Tax=Dioscorea zingiberensis TaxID=325984 RepID=A0A9D5HMD2_9LILI|nr:hypothetical protein J5N97_010309 [Dioscorea zingiberensis]